jgi:hypothetical protein
MNSGLLFDKIQRYYLEDGPLSSKEKEMVQRYELIFSLFTEHRHRGETLSKYIAVCAEKGIDISLGTAYRDLKTAEKIFVPMGKYSTEFLRQTIIESALRDIANLEKKLNKKKLSHDNYVNFMRLKHLAETRIGKYSGLLHEDSRLPDFDKLQPHTIQLELSPTSLLMLDKMYDGNIVDLTNIDVEDIEIIEEELSSESEENEPD